MSNINSARFSFEKVFVFTFMLSFILDVIGCTIVMLWLYGLSWLTFANLATGLIILTSTSLACSVLMTLVFVIARWYHRQKSKD